MINISMNNYEFIDIPKIINNFYSLKKLDLFRSQLTKMKNK